MRTKLSTVLMAIMLIVVSSRLRAAPVADGDDRAHVAGIICAAADVSRDEQLVIKGQVDDWISGHAGTLAAGGNIKVAWHVISDGATGNIPQSQIDATITVLNEAYAGVPGGANTGYTFSLASVSRTNKRQWFGMEAGSNAERQAKTSLATDVPHRLNVYSCKPPSGANWGTFPWSSAEGDRMQGVVLHYGYLPGGYLAPLNTGDIAVHEVGHYLGLYHTFQGGCTPPGDEVDDTPDEAVPPGCCPCPEGRDTCPSAGLDPIHNYMDYTSDVCKTEFTAGQDVRMDSIVPVYRPNLLDAPSSPDDPTIALASGDRGDEALRADGASVEWTDATTGPLGNTGHGFGMAWGDYDNDGDLDLFFTNYAGTIRNKLLRNDGGGAFADATSGPLGAANTLGSYGVAWGDYDNDGDLDLYLSQLSYGNKLFRNDGGGVFADATSGPLGDTGNNRGVAWGDYDNDGDLDLFVTAGDAQGSTSKLFRNDGGSWVNATSGPLGATRTSAAAWGDYDNDGDLDLHLARSSGEESKLLRNDGNGAFVDVTSGPLAFMGNGVAWGDYDNDGDLDLIVADWGGCRLLRNDGGDTFADATTGPLGYPGNTNGVAWGDYDNDGDLDLYLANYGTENKLFRNDGGGTFVDATNGPLGITGNGRGVGFGDYDNDGDLDIYLVNDGPNKLFRNDQATGNHWLEVKLRGTVSNRSAIGARVRVVAEGLSQIQEVSGGSGFLSQNSLGAEFGLGAATIVESVVITWPSGIVQRLADVGVDQSLLVVEDETAGAGLAAAMPRELRSPRGVPNPFRSGTTIAYDLAEDGPVRLRVFDSGGRLVRALVDSELQKAGHRETTWDGRDAAGGDAPAGVYFYRLDAGASRHTERLVLLP